MEFPRIPLKLRFLGPIEPDCQVHLATVHRRKNTKPTLSLIKPNPIASIYLIKFPATHITLLSPSRGV